MAPADAARVALQTRPRPRVAQDPRESQRVEARVEAERRRRRARGLVVAREREQLAVEVGVVRR